MSNGVVKVQRRMFEVDEGLGGSSRSDEYQKKTSGRDEDSESMIEAQTRRTFFFLAEDVNRQIKGSARVGI